MDRTGAKQGPEPFDPHMLRTGAAGDRELAAARERQAELLRLLWNRRRSLLRAGIVGLLFSILVAFLLPKSYTATAQLMPPDSQSSNGLAMMAALAGKTLGALAGLTGDLLNMKSSGALFIGVLRSETSEDRIIQQFDLKKVYGSRLIVDARKRLDENTVVTEDRKSGIITIRVTDHDAQRAAAMANAYVDELNSLVAQLSTSAAHRERVFLEDRLKVAKVELDDAANQLAQFSSKNKTLDIQIEGRAMLDAAGTLAGQLIAAQSELEGLRQIYTDNNARVKALSARVAMLRKQLERFGGEENLQVPPEKGAASQILQAADPPAEKAVSPFPTIHNLPLLAAKYSDYYRRAKIQETVFELLTEQYELAKVQEAKETPSVKTLDPARVPERKSYPPRFLIVFVGMFLAVGCTATWLITAKSFAAVTDDPRKALAVEVVSAVRVHLPWKSQNGNTADSLTARIWSRARNHRPPTDGPVGF